MAASGDIRARSTVREVRRTGWKCARRLSMRIVRRRPAIAGTRMCSRKKAKTGPVVFALGSRIHIATGPWMSIARMTVCLTPYRGACSVCSANEMVHTQIKTYPTRNICTLADGRTSVAPVRRRQDDGALVDVDELLRVNAKHARDAARPHGRVHPEALAPRLVALECVHMQPLMREPEALPPSQDRPLVPGAGRAVLGRVLLHEGDGLVEADVGLGESDQAQVVLLVLGRLQRAPATGWVALEPPTANKALVPAIHRRE